MNWLWWRKPVEVARVIEREKMPRSCVCFHNVFIITDRGAGRTCEQCGQHYVLKLVQRFLDNEGRCPDCNGDLYEGPSGGVSMNVHCAKGHRFNLTMLPGGSGEPTVILERI